MVLELKTQKYHLRYLEQLTNESRKHRKHETEAEKIIWQKLLRKKQLGVKFVRQKPIDRFILDFYCAKLSLAIEIDGGYHQLIEERDIERDKFLQVCGIKTLRFRNDEVLNNLEQVKHKILTYIPPCPVKGRVGEGF